MKKGSITKYLILFILVGLLTAAVLLCFFRQMEWWSPWMVSAPILYMALSALYCPMMKKNIDAKVQKQTWLYLYKGIKIALTIVMVALYFFLAPHIEKNIDTKAFVIITAFVYLLGLFIETYCFMDYMKRQTK